MRLSFVLLTTAVAAAFCAPALAGGPVFAVVPNTPTPFGTVATQRTSTPALRSELEADRKALADARAARAGAEASLTRLDERADAAPLLSDRLDLEHSATQAQLTLDGAAAQVDQLRGQIAALEGQLRAASVAPFGSVTPDATGQTVGLQAVSIAAQYLGVPYRWGGADPLAGFDCSGLTLYVYGQLGIPLRHYAADQWSDLPHVAPSQLEPGDLVFFEPRFDGPGHVGIYTGGDSFIEAPHTGDVVKIASLSAEARSLGFVGAARPALSGGGFFDPFG